MTNTDDLKAKFIEQEQSRNADSSSSPGNSGEHGRRKFGKLKLLAVAGVGLLLAGWLLGGPAKPACKDVVFRGQELSDDSIASLKLCTPEQIFHIGQERRPKNLQEALILFELAARDGHGPAARTIGEMYDPHKWSRLSSPFAAPDESLALKWYKRAETLGDTGLHERIPALGGTITK